MSQAAATDFEYDPLTFHEDPYPVYRQLRDVAPLYHHKGWDLWVISRYADVQAAARDWETFSNARGVDIDEGDFTFGPGDLLDTDPPRHDELRKILHTTFYPKGVKPLEPMVAAKVDALLSPLVARGGGDFAAEFAHLLPFSVICELWGLPPQDHHLLGEWFDRMVVREPGQMAIPDDVWRAGGEMKAYLDEAVRIRRTQPKGDLLTTMATAINEGLMSEEEVVGMTRILLIAGIHTTETLIANSLLLLEPMPKERRLLAEDPSRIPPAIEELLRFEPPVQWLARAATRDVELYEQTIPEGARVVIQWAAANRDERYFDDPDALNLRRSRNRHMTFGQGIHFCLGAHLARLESRVAFHAFLTRIPDYRISGPIERLYTHQERGISGLPIEVIDARE
jgi:cytochrome P450